MDRRHRADRFTMTDWSLNMLLESVPRLGLRSSCNSAGPQSLQWLQSCKQQKLYVLKTDNETTCFHAHYYYPAPGRGTGYNCFRAISFFVSMSTRLRENGWTDLDEIFREGVEWPWDDVIKFRVNLGKRVGGSKVNLFVSPAIAQSTGVNKSVSFARWQQEAGFVVRASHHSLLHDFSVRRP